MKGLIINVVTFFAWIGVAFWTLGGYIGGSASGHEVLGATGGFLIGCITSGLWFLLSSIHDKLSAIADVAKQYRTPDNLLPVPKEETWVEATPAVNTEAWLAANPISKA